MAITIEKRPPAQKQEQPQGTRDAHHSDRAALQRNSSLQRLRARVKYSSWYVRALLFEMSSLFQRMRILSERMNPLAYHVDLGPLTKETPEGHAVTCMSTASRSRCIEAVSTKYPWVTDAELLIALDAWEMGSEYTRGNLDTSNTEIQFSQEDQYPLALAER